MKNNYDKYNDIIDKTTDKYITTLSINYENLIYPKFMIFIMDIDYSILNTEAIQKKYYYYLLMK